MPICPGPCATDGDCRDEDNCNGDERCVESECIAGEPLVCDDGDACNGIETCASDSGCQSGTPPVCDDGNICNGLEACAPDAGCRSGTPLTCDDGIECTDDSCDPTAGCQHLANDTSYGLASYIATKDIATAVKVAEALEYGIVSIGDFSPATVQAPFGGWKESGIGREGGHEGIDEYLESKYVALVLE